MENQLQQRNISGVRKSLKTISGQRTPDSQAAGDQTWVNDMNLFFNRFDQTPTPPPTQPSLLTPTTSPILPVYCPILTSTSLSMAFMSQTTPTAPPDIHPPPTSDTQPSCSTLSLSSLQVRNELRKMKVKKATGPDGISSRLLKSCADQLCRIVEYIFNMSLKLGKVPLLWKTSCVVPVPKIPHPKDFNNYRPVALTSHLMKTLEQLFLIHLRLLVGPFMDPLQFAYQPSIDRTMPSSSSWTDHCLTWRSLEALSAFTCTA